MSKVPRRESPWGMPEGDNREPKAHRCNDRAEDVIQVLILWFSIFFPSRMLVFGFKRFNYLYYFFVFLIFSL
jgi:hypothetical protein